MRRIGSVIERDAVFAVRGAFARDDQNLAIGSGADIVDQARIYFHRVGQFRMRRIRNVIDQKPIRERRVVSIVADDPFFSALKFFEWRAAYDFEVAFDIARRHHD